MTRALITGITGFAGSWLADYILGRKDKVELFGVRMPGAADDNILHIKDRIALEDCNLLDASGIRRLVGDIRPEMIFHLAAQSFVPASWDSPAQTLETNIVGELNLLEAVRRADVKAAIHIASSGEVYGSVSKEKMPIKETAALNPASPYAVSKAMQDALGHQYYRSYGLRVVRTRAFNHAGPRQGEDFVVACFARQIAMIEAGLQEPAIHTGDLSSVRDFTDVRDVARAYWLSLEKGSAGEVYNICSSHGRSIEEALDILKKLSKMKFTVKNDPKHLRPSDLPELVGDNTKFVRKTGWRPEIPFEKTLEDTLNYWRGRVGKDKAAHSCAA